MILMAQSTVWRTMRLVRVTGFDSRSGTAGSMPVPRESDDERCESSDAVQVAITVVESAPER